MDDDRVKSHLQRADRQRPALQGSAAQVLTGRSPTTCVGASRELRAELGLRLKRERVAVCLRCARSRASWARIDRETVARYLVVRHLRELGRRTTASVANHQSGSVNIAWPADVKEFDRRQRCPWVCGRSRRQCNYLTGVSTEWGHPPQPATLEHYSPLLLCGPAESTGQL
jgi:hypothetical protein